MDKSLTLAKVLLGSTDPSVDPNVDLKEAGFGSLDIMEIVINVEHDFGINIPDNIVESFNTINDIVEYIDKQLNQEGC